ncbi:hypothetical protein Y027_5581 [Burkholderia pseudomallei TSV5]|nr:hypothetical protein Y027_5581 [Burkholderia pseudomallei TSV5]
MKNRSDDRRFAWQPLFEFLNCTTLGAKLCPP